MKTVWQFEGYAWSFGGLRWGEQAAPTDSENWIWDAESDFTQTTSWINMLYLGCWICTQAEMWNITIYGFRAKDLLQQFPEEPQVYPYSQSTSAQQLTGTIPPRRTNHHIYISICERINSTLGWRVSFCLSQADLNIYALLRECIRLIQV